MTSYVGASNLAYARENDSSPKDFFASKEPLERQWKPLNVAYKPNVVYL